MRVRLLVALLLALVATACSVDNSSVTAIPSPQAASSMFYDINGQPPVPVETAPSSSSSAVDAAPPSPSASGVTAPTASAFVDPGPGLPPSERCGFDVPVTIGRIGLALDLVIVAPTEHFDATEITETLPDQPSTVEKGIACFVVHDRDTSSVSCGVSQGTTGTVALRHEALPATMVMFLAESTDQPVALPEMKLWKDCDRDRRIAPLDIAADPNRPVETVKTTITKDLLSPIIDTAARFYVAQDPDDGPYSDELCAAVQAVADGQRAAGAALLDALGIDFFWQPLPSGEIPDPVKLSALDAVIDDYSGTIIQTRQAGEDETVFGLTQIAGLSSFLWSRVATVNIDHEQRDDERFADHIAWQVGGVAVSGMDHFETASLLEAILANRCTAEQLAQFAGAWAARGDDSSEICTDLAVAYQARTRFRAALNVDPSERRELQRYLLPADRLLTDLRSQYPGMNDNPFFSNEALSGFYYAEYSLARRVDDGNVLRQDEVAQYETNAAPMHDFARENCPSITSVDVPSVFELVPATDEGQVERARVAFCTDFSALLNARNTIRDAVDDQAGLQPFTTEIAQAMAELGDRTSAISERWPDDQVLLNPEGNIYAALLKRPHVIELMVRQANFAPVVIPMAVNTDSYDDSSDMALRDFVLSSCPDIGQDQFAATSDPALLPGPTFPALGFYVGAADLCTAANRSVEARAGFRDAIDRHLAGDPYARADAVGFRATFAEYAYSLPEAFSAAFPDLDSDIGEAFGTTEAEVTRSFRDGSGYPDLLAEGLELMPTFVSQVTAACPSIDASAFGTVEQTQALYDQFGADGDVALPAVLGISDVCAVLDQAFERRVQVRAGIENADLDAVDEAVDQFYADTLYGVEEYPEGFEEQWISALKSSERALYYRLAYDEPQSRSNLAGWEISTNELIDWVRANCSQITVGLDLPSAATVFPEPDPAEVDQVQAEICAAINDLFDARVTFRSYVAQPQADFPAPAQAAYRKLLAAATTIDRLWTDQQLYVDPSGDLTLYSRANLIVNDESMVRQAHFGPLPIPMTQASSSVPAAELRRFAQALCDDVTESASVEIAPLSDVAGPVFAPLSAEPTEAELAQVFCQNLEIALLARFHMLEHLQSAVQDAGAGFEADAYYQRFDDVSFGNSVGDAFTEAQFDQRRDGTTMQPATRGMIEILARVATSPPSFDDRWDVEDALATPEVLDQLVIDRCTQIPDAALDLSVPEALQLFDALTAR